MKKRISIVILLTLAIVFSFQFFTLSYAGDYRETTRYYDDIKHQYPKDHLHSWNRMLRFGSNGPDLEDCTWEEMPILRPDREWAHPWGDSEK